MDEFITDLYAIAKYKLHDELIRDSDAHLSEKMQMEPELTLQRAVTLAQQSECVKTQHPTVKGELSQESFIEVVRGDKTLSKAQNRGQVVVQKLTSAPCISINCLKGK